MKTRRADLIAFVSIVCGGVLTGTSLATADGTETLGTPSVEVAAGTGVAVGGVGLFDQPGTLGVEVPGDATVRQVLLYVESGHSTSSANPVDDTFSVNGHELTCGSIGGPAYFYGDIEASTFRCDITDLGLVHAGSNSLTVGGLDTADINDGAGVLVIFEQPGGGSVQLVDGNDIAFVDFEGARGVTVPQTFTVTPSEQDRTASLALMVGSIANYQKPDEVPRPMTLRITSGGVVTDLHDPFAVDPDNAQFDAAVIPDVFIPAGAGSVTVELLSQWGRDGLPASLVWVSAALATPPAFTTPTSTEVPTTQTTLQQLTPTTPSTATPSTTPPSTPTSVVIESTVTTLPVTGGDAGLTFVIGSGFLVAGLAAFAASRRRYSLSSRP